MQVVEFGVAEKLLSKYKIPLARTVFVVSEKELLKNIGKFKYPLFLKIYGKNIFRRTDIGGVEEVKNKADLKKTFLKMMKIKGAEGILVQEKIEGKNLIIGTRKDPQFGPVVMCGIGGIFAEVFNDFALRIAPVSEKEALKMLTELKGYDYLCGKRDKKPINFKEVSKVIVAISSIGLNEEEIKDVTLNPVISNEKIATTVDFKFLI